MPAPDTFTGFSNLSSQGERWVSVTPSDTVDLISMPKALWIDVAGNLTIEGSDGVAATFVVPQGLLPLRPSRVRSTGTTATGIKAIY